MAKFPTFPTLYDEALAVSLPKLIKWGYLKPDQIRSGVLTWSSRGQQTASISIRVNTAAESPYIELDYKHNGKPVHYRVEFVSVPSNLGKGRVWYFLCPHTGKRCRKLFSIGKKFLHREAFTGCMYESQTYSHKARSLNKLFDRLYGVDKLYLEIRQKHFKCSYAGKPTKRYTKLMQKIRAAESAPYTEIDLLMMR